MPYQNRILIIVIALGILAACYVAGQRIAVERANRVVEVGVEWQEVDQLSAMTGTPVRELLRRLKQAGVTTVIIHEDTLDSLRQDGYIAMTPELLTQRGQPAWATHIDLQAPDRPLRARIESNIERRMQALLLPPIATGELLVPARASDVGFYGMGLDTFKMRDAVEAGLRMAVRPTPDGVGTAHAVAWVLDQMQASPPGLPPSVEHRVVIFSGSSVLGAPGLIRDTASWLQARDSSPDGLCYGSVEFGNQRGDAELSSDLHGHVVRVHAITLPEMQTITPAAAIERFVRGVRERNIRFCYVRLFLTASADPLGKNEQYLEGLAAGLRQAGYQPGGARPFEAFAPPRSALILVALAVAAGALLLLNTLVALSGRSFVILAVIGIVLCPLAMVGAPGLARKALALLAALAFPVLALVSYTPPPHGARPPSSAFWHALKRYALCSLVSVVGGVLIVGLLSSVPFMVKADQFAGVKLALSVPTLAVAAVFLAGSYRAADTARGQCRLAVENWRHALDQVVKYSHVIIIFVALVAGAVVLLRSGNEPGFGLSGAELRFRDTLERVLGARPRQKEFLVGHPLLLLSFFLLLRGRSRGMWAALAAATLGQSSMVNTFCHIHTPLTMSLLRTFNGLWAGALVGLVAIVVYRIGWERRPPRNEPG